MAAARSDPARNPAIPTQTGVQSLLPGPLAPGRGGTPDTAVTEAAPREQLRAAGLVEIRGEGAYLTAAGERALFEVCRAARPDLPRWDAKLRRLYWRGAVVKHLRREACCQAAVLAAFEAAGWPARIDDPLADDLGLDPKERLRETVKSLMRGLTPHTIRFHADGTGTGIE